MGTRPMPAVRPVSASYLTAVGAHLQQGRDLIREMPALSPGS